MNNMDLIKQMPEMLSGKELYEKLADIPVYDEIIREKSQTERLMALSTLYDIYLPSEMSVEIYLKLYLALLRSLQKKALMQQCNNYIRIIRPLCKEKVEGLSVVLILFPLLAVLV